MYYLYVNQKIDKGLSDIENGAVLTQSEAREALRKGSAYVYELLKDELAGSQSNSRS